MGVCCGKNTQQKQGGYPQVPASQTGAVDFLNAGGPVSAGHETNSVTKPNQPRQNAERNQSYGHR